MTTGLYPNTCIFMRDVPKIEQAISNGWKLRPLNKSGGYANKGYQNQVQVSRTDHILTKISDLKAYPKNYVSSVAVMPNLLDDFICLDFDFTEKPSLSKSLMAVLTSVFKKEELVCRTGSTAKLGQFWFKYEQAFDVSKKPKPKKVDLITWHPRCDAIGRYWKEKNQSYRHPYKKFYEITPEELPVIDEQTFDSIIQICIDHLGQDRIKNSDKNNLTWDYEAEQGERHDWLRDMAMKNISKMPPTDLFFQLAESVAFHSFVADDGLDATTQKTWNLITSALNKIIQKGEYEPTPTIQNPYEAFIDEYDTHRPIPEDGSVFDVMYRACLRNHPTDAQELVYYSLISLFGFLLSFRYQFSGFRPNLLMLLVAKSGAGKSAGLSLWKYINTKFRELRIAQNLEISTVKSFVKSFETGPFQYCVINEFTGLQKRIKSNDSNAIALVEKINSYFSDYIKPDDLAYTKTGGELYGACYSPTPSLLLLATPTFKKYFEEEDYTSGFGRRMILHHEEKFHAHKHTEGFSLTEKEEEIISEFIDKFVFGERPLGNVFDDETVDQKNGFVTHNLFDVKEVPHGEVKIPNPKKKESQYLAFAPGPKPPVDLRPENKDAEFYLKEGLLDIQNKMLIASHEENNDFQDTVINSLRVNVYKIAPILALTFKKNPKEKIDLKSLKDAASLSKLLMDNVIDAFNDGAVIEGNKDNSISQAVVEFKEFLKENKIKQFTKTREVHGFFRRQSYKKNRDMILENAELKGYIKALNPNTSRKRVVYEVI